MPMPFNVGNEASSTKPRGSPVRPTAGCVRSYEAHRRRLGGDVAPLAALLGVSRSEFRGHGAHAGPASGPCPIGGQTAAENRTSQLRLQVRYIWMLRDDEGDAGIMVVSLQLVGGLVARRIGHVDDACCASSRYLRSLPPVQRSCRLLSCGCHLRSSLRLLLFREGVGTAL